MILILILIILGIEFRAWYTTGFPPGISDELKAQILKEQHEFVLLQLDKQVNG